MAEEHVMPTRWERSKHVFEKILEDSQKATERLVATLEELGEKTKARVERARVQRALFRRTAELGSRIFDLSRARDEGPRKDPFEDVSVSSLLLDITKLDEELKKVEAQIAKD
jgi:hypothetical protein